MIHVRQRARPKRRIRYFTEWGCACLAERYGRAVCVTTNFRHSVALMLLDDKTTWWPLHASRPEPHEEIAPAFNLQLAAIHAPIAMAGASALLFFNHGERLHFARAFPAFGLMLVALVVALRFAIAYAWNVRARRLQGER